jgi:hypothetical protein
VPALAVLLDDPPLPEDEDPPLPEDEDEDEDDEDGEDEDVDGEDAAAGVADVDSGFLASGLVSPLEDSLGLSALASAGRESLR